MMFNDEIKLLCDHINSIKKTYLFPFVLYYGLNGKKHTIKEISKIIDRCAFNVQTKRDKAHKSIMYFCRINGIENITEKLFQINFEKAKYKPMEFIAKTKE